MKLIKIGKSELNQTREVPGLLQSRIEYEIKSGRGTLQYNGPKFDPQMWRQVLSFFAWTHQEMQSESQVRLYVNTHLGRWGAWAFPQEARSGMNAREIAIPETPGQARERFASWGTQPSEDWFYFATVHHHCGATAFQSNVDEENERDQDGLHITVGRLDEERLDLHVRFYLGGNCFEPDMSRFWPIDPELARQVPPSMLDGLARHQMCEKVLVAFPEAWKANVIEVPKSRELDINGHWRERRQGSLPIDQAPYWVRLERALNLISHHCAAFSVSEAEWMGTLQSLCNDPAGSAIMRACVEQEVNPEDLLAEIAQAEFDCALPR